MIFNALVPDVILTLEKAGLFLEIPVDELSAPFLVSSTRDYLWLDSIKNGRLRSAVIQGGLPETVYRDIVHRVQVRGLEQQWENSFPPTPEGVLGGVDYLRFYGMGSLTLLVSDLELELPETLEGVDTVKAPWVPTGSGVLVPTDRSYLGMVGLCKNAYTVVIHNPTRGMAILGTW